MDVVWERGEQKRGENIWCEAELRTRAETSGAKLSTFGAKLSFAPGLIVS
jgi:hypothetical protein